jgi:hypothetical protein
VLNTLRGSTTTAALPKGLSHHLRAGRPCPSQCRPANNHDLMV